LSGIVGIFRRRGGPVERAVLESLSKFLAYRGPEGVEVWSDGVATGFGHAMLRTTREAEGERQPASVEGRLWITADARIDCRNELLGELERAGRSVGPEACDAELILRAYGAWGEQCLQRLRGDFAFAIWDGMRKRLFCARDHFGIKPFYYALKDDLFVFSNTLNCVRMHPEMSDELNDAAIGDFLLFGLNCDLATTAFRDIARLPPAHFLSVWADGARTERYWSPPFGKRIRYRDTEEYIEHFGAILKAAVSDRLRADRVGIFLSGGLDSGAIAAAGAELCRLPASGTELRAYTEVFDKLFFDEEGTFARATASFLKIHVEIVKMDDLQPFDRWENNAPEPIDAPVFAGLLDNYSRIASDCRVALSGEGSDNLMYFQMWPYAQDLLRKGEWSTFCREMAHFLWVRPFPWRGIGFHLRWLAGRDPSRGEFPDFITPEFAKRLDLKQRWMADPTRGPYVDRTRPKISETLGSPLWTQLHEMNDPGVTGCALEFRYPFCDLRLVEYLLSIPPFPWHFQKRIVRGYLRGRVPEAVRLRPKAALRGSPFVEILQRSDSDWRRRVKAADKLERYVESSRLADFPKEKDADRARTMVRPFCLNFWLQSQALGYKLNFRGVE
jgi:asparagine synthase (glutamine-hydrolysing)